MKTVNDLWETIGELDSEESFQVLARVFSVYEKLHDEDPENREALGFFKTLGVALMQTSGCNLNRR